jgi:hypothetical protein
VKRTSVTSAIAAIHPTRKVWLAELQSTALTMRELTMFARSTGTLCR